MIWRQINLGEVVASPWRNGGGVTRELAAWPPGNDKWMWRMAVAEIAQDGPFSHFPGIERWFAVLSGGGVKLSIGGLPQQLTCHSAPLCFDGDVATDCTLLAGATTDFNLMVRGGRAKARMARISGHLEVVLKVPKTIAVYAIDGDASVNVNQRTLLVMANGLAWQALPAGAVLQVSASAALWIEIEPCA